MKFSISLFATLFVISVPVTGTVPRLGRPGNAVELPSRPGQPNRDPIPRPLVPAPGQSQQPPPTRYYLKGDIQVVPQVLVNKQGNRRPGIKVSYTNVQSGLLTTPVDVDMVDAQLRWRLINNLNLNENPGRKLNVIIESNITAPTDSNYHYRLQFVDNVHGYYYQSKNFSFGENPVTTSDQTDQTDPTYEAGSPVDSTNDGASPSSSTHNPTMTSSNSPVSPSSTNGSGLTPTNGVVTTTLASVLYMTIILSGITMALVHVML